jgi:hypothetical protein
MSLHFPKVHFAFSHRPWAAKGVGVMSSPTLAGFIFHSDENSPLFLLLTSFFMPPESTEDITTAYHVSHMDVLGFEFPSVWVEAEDFPVSIHCHTEVPSHNEINATCR